MIFHLDDNGAVFSNPGMGWVIHHSAISGKKDVNEPDSYENLDNVALLSYWAALEPEEGVFAWERLDASIAKWTALGKKLQFRISTDPMLYDGKGDGVPDWVFERYGVPCQVVEEDGYTVRYPDYRNPVYLEKLRNFLNALADRYGGNPDLETVDLRGYGAWGEWHSGFQHPTRAEHAAALRGILDVWYDAFGGKKTLILSCSYEWMNTLHPALHAPESYEEYLAWSGFDYALAKPGISLRRDGIGGAVKLWDARIMKDYYASGRREPMICEYFGGYNEKLPLGGRRGYNVEDSVEEALMLHPNYMMLMWDSVDFCQKRPDLIAHGLKRMGYRLLPERVEVPDEVKAGEFFFLRHDWTNRAAGRFCGGSSLEFRLRDPEGRRWDLSREDGFDAGSLGEGERRSFHTPLQVPEKAAPGECILELRLRGYGGQTILLPLEGKTNDGFYPVAALRVK